jgi:glycogen phosphorylase
MEYLQGRALTNAVGNLGITGAYAEAVKKSGYELEALAAEVSSLTVPRGATP